VSRSGCGLNISNEHPTICLNTILAKHGKPTLPAEVVLAGALSTFANDFEQFELDGFHPFRARYYSRWIHRSATTWLALTGLILCWLLRCIWTVDLTGLSVFLLVVLCSLRCPSACVAGSGQTVDVLITPATASSPAVTNQVVIEGVTSEGRLVRSKSLSS
jgi:hypothetical protein